MSFAELDLVSKQLTFSSRYLIAARGLVLEENLRAFVGVVSHLASALPPPWGSAE